MSDQARDLRAVGSRIEELIGQIRAAGDAAIAERAEEVVRLVVELYGAGLERTVELAGLLVLHGLHPKDTQTRVREALDQVRPYLGSHAGGVELLGLDDEGVVRLRLEGSCDGCPSSTMTVKLAIEEAVHKAAPDVEGIEAEGAAEHAPPPLLQLRRVHRPAPVAVDPARAADPDVAPPVVHAPGGRSTGHGAAARRRC